METVFDFEPTQLEIESIAFNYLTLGLRCGNDIVKPTKDFYLSNIKGDWAIFDIALLLTDRGETAQAAKYWEMIPAETIFTLTDDSNLIAEILGYKISKSDYHANIAQPQSVIDMISFAEYTKDGALKAELEARYSNDLSQFFNE